jgi:hypothetical protein
MNMNLIINININTTIMINVNININIHIRKNINIDMYTDKYWDSARISRTNFLLIGYRIAPISGYSDIGINLNISIMSNPISE